MPCSRCGVRQTDPGRGPSLWKRGVRGGELVLVCPECQRGRDWAADLDRCPGCGSTALVRALGETVCRGCGGRERDPHPGPAARSQHGAPGLAADVERALERLLRPAAEDTVNRPEGP